MQGNWYIFINATNFSVYSVEWYYYPTHKTLNAHKIIYSKFDMEFMRYELENDQTWNSKKKTR